MGYHIFHYGASCYLLPVTSKIQEHVANEFTKNIKNQLYNLQYGFQSGRSCVAQLLLVYQEIGKYLDAGLDTDLMLLDFAKAFDSVCPKKLLLWPFTCMV